MVLVFTCTMMVIHGDLGPDKFEKCFAVRNIYTRPSDQNN